MTKVELRFDLPRINSGDGVKAPRARASAAHAHGKLIVTCDTTRSQSQNLELARERLADLVLARRAENDGPPRRAGARRSASSKTSPRREEARTARLDDG
jgi:hypothetical protein